MYQYDFKKLGKIVYDRDYFSLLGIERYIINFFFFCFDDDFMESHFACQYVYIKIL